MNQQLHVLAFNIVKDVFHRTGRAVHGSVSARG
jgi:hypothetical protein